jgi:hypothetical protein
MYSGFDRAVLNTRTTEQARRTQRRDRRQQYDPHRLSYKFGCRRAESWPKIAKCTVFNDLIKIKTCETAKSGAEARKSNELSQLPAPPGGGAGVAQLIRSMAVQYHCPFRIWDDRARMSCLSRRWRSERTCICSRSAALV